MSLKAELETWAAALKAYDEEDFEKSLDLFSVRSLSLPWPSWPDIIIPSLPSRGSATRPRSSQTWVSYTLPSVSTKLPSSNSSQPLASTSILPSRTSFSAVLPVLLPHHTTYALSTLDTFNAVSPTFCSAAMTLPPKTSRRPYSISVETSPCMSFYLPPY